MEEAENNFVLRAFASPFVELVSSFFDLAEYIHTDFEWNSLLQFPRAAAHHLPFLQAITEAHASPDISICSTEAPSAPFDSWLFTASAPAILQYLLLSGGSDGSVGTSYDLLSACYCAGQ